MKKNEVKSLHHKTYHGVPFSVLELALVNEGSDAETAFKHSVSLAQHLEKWGYHRIWFAEHHNMPGVASSATAILIAHIAGKTETIRVGSGGIMLPNHAPLVVAEQFGTLETLFPGRIDLGIGRAPGTDQQTALALRRNLNEHARTFPDQLAELRQYFSNDPDMQVRAYPGRGLDIPIWLLGSSDYSAQLAAYLGLPFSFASHFAPQALFIALSLYRNEFQPSKQLAQPYVMVAVNIIAADTDEKAQFLATSLQQQFLNINLGRATKLQPPREITWSLREKAIISQSLDPLTTIIGSKATVQAKLDELLAKTDADEIIISSSIYDHEDRLRSFEIISELLT